MTRVEIDWLYPTMHVKDQILGNVFRGTFPDSFRQNLSLHPQCLDILQSTSCQIWDFLPSSGGCLQTLWLKICVANDKFGFPAKVFLQGFEWFCLEINNDEKYFPLLSKPLWSRISSYSIQFLNQKQKKNTLFIVVTWISCILRHHIYIYIYIVIHRQTVSFYQNSSVWLDRQDSRNWDRNLAEWNSNSRFYHSATRKPEQVKEI